MAMSMGRDYSRIWLIVPAGLVLGLGYTLSPLTVLSLAVWSPGQHDGLPDGLTEGERRWFWSLLSTAIGIRLIALAVLFLTADPSRPFASFFGDEELYKFRTVWLRNIGQGMPISPADVIYSYDDVGRTGHIFVLALVQAMVGDAPYGLHLLNMALYLCGVLALYRFVRACLRRRRRDGRLDRTAAAAHPCALVHFGAEGTDERLHARRRVDLRRAGGARAALVAEGWRGRWRRGLGTGNGESSRRRSADGSGRHDRRHRCWSSCCRAAGGCCWR